MPAYTKHLVSCNCVLRQFQDVDPPIFHKFIVFSVINDDGSIKPSYARCNNCAGIHKVTEVGVSEKLKRESAPFLPTVEEIKTTLPEKLVGLIEKYDLDLPSWQEIQFIMEHELWDRYVLLSKESEGTEIYGKMLIIAGKTLWMIKDFSSEET